MIVLILALACYLLVCRTSAAGVAFTNDALNYELQQRALTWHLFTNNITPVPTSVASDFTELSESGYSAQTTAASSWTLTDDTTGTNADHANLTFTWTTASGVTIYGYYVLDSFSNFIGGESFSTGGITYAAGPSSLVLTPGARAQA